MKYAHIINFVNAQPWAIMPEKLEAIIGLLEFRAAGLRFTEAQIDARVGAFGDDPPVVREDATGVAVLRLHGTIVHRINFLTESSGGISVERFAQEFRRAMASPKVSGIVIDIDSPGGGTAGLEELSAEIRAARQEKPILSVASSLAASAAFQIGSAASEFSVTPSGHVGSVGVLGVHMDFSKKAENEGATVSVISAGKFKSEQSEFTPLSDEARDHLQSLVDDRFDAFINDVAAGRRVSAKAVRERFGQGRVVPAKAALAAGMVDRIETLEEGIARMQRGEVRRARGSRTTVASSVILQKSGGVSDEELAAGIAEAVMRGMAARADGSLEHANPAESSARLDPDFVLQEAELAEAEEIYS